jgi:hypothetical protein
MSLTMGMVVTHAEGPMKPSACGWFTLVRPYEASDLDPQHLTY